MNTIRTWRFAAWSMIPLVLLVPLVAMQLTDEVKWTALDFVFMGALLTGAGVAFELGARMTRSAAYRLALGLAIATAAFLVWVNAAVGIVGSEQDDFNMLYGGVLIVGVLSATIARFSAKGMIVAMATTAVAQASVAALALFLDKHHGEVGGAAQIVGVNGMFVALFLGSAFLFSRAERG